MVDLRAPVRSVLSSRGMEVPDDQLFDMIKDLQRLAELLVTISEEAEEQVPEGRGQDSDVEEVTREEVRQ